MSNRAAQALVKLALEPEWEAKLEPNVYGFRPGRSCQDAIAAIFRTICQKPKYVLEGDIKGCFDNISHQALLDKIGAPPFILRQIRAWLNCGVLDQVFQPTNRGTPQGGVISPLLALIALNGLESQLKAMGTQRNPIHTVFYADDFVVFASQLCDIQSARVAVEQWLQGIGLELHPSKTKITHTLHGQAGFDFLGFNIRQYPVGKYASKRGYKTLIKPSKSSQKRHSNRLKEIVSMHKAAPQAALIAHLNPVISGWCRYFSSVVSKATFAAMDAQLFYKLFRWAKRRHPNFNSHSRVSRYWLVNKGGGWTFQSKEGHVLLRHNQTPIRRHVKARANRSPYDGDWTYWGMRLRTYLGLSPLCSNLLKQQDGKCFDCGLVFTPNDCIELHHLDGNHDNNRLNNLALLHRHCHDQAHRQYGSTKPTDLAFLTKDQVGEEPDDGKLSSPVLKPSRKGNFPA